MTKIEHSYSNRSQFGLYKYYFMEFV